MRRPMVAVTALALLALAGTAGAFTFPEWEQYGYVVPTYDARSLAMGGAGLASVRGAAAMAVNPALLGKTDGTDVAFTSLVVLAEEAREAPMHDSFDGVIGYNTYALNNGLYDRFAGAIAFNPSGEFAQFEWAPVVALGYGPRVDMSYDCHIQYRDPDFQTEPADKILYDYYLEGDGGVNAFTVGLGQEVALDIYVGLGVDFMRGDFDRSERTVYPADSDEEDVASSVEYQDVTGTRFTLGVQYERIHRIDLALVYRAGYTLSGEYDDGAGAGEERGTADFEHKYPGTLAFGVRYRPRNLLATTVSCDVEFTRWSEFEDDAIDGDPGLDDTVVYRLGVEHGFFDNTFARFGFAYIPSYVDNTNTTAAFSLGLGLDVLGARVDIGGQVGIREYGIDGGRVRETTTLAMATLTHSF